MTFVDSDIQQNTEQVEAWTMSNRDSVYRFMKHLPVYNDVLLTSYPQGDKLPTHNQLSLTRNGQPAAEQYERDSVVCTSRPISQIRFTTDFLPP